MPFHVRTDFKHAISHAPNTLPSRNAARHHRNGTTRASTRGGLNRRPLSAAPPDRRKSKNRAPSVTIVSFAEFIAVA